jgi:plasmid stabilization system protein ParE
MELYELMCPIITLRRGCLTAQIEQTVEEADNGKFASDEQVAAIRARRWSRNAVEWLARALKNLEDQANYIALENPKAADDFSEAIFASVDRLAQFPDMGREGRVRNTREWAVPNWSYLRFPIACGATACKSWVSFIPGNVRAQSGRENRK